MNDSTLEQELTGWLGEHRYMTFGYCSCGEWEAEGGKHFDDPDVTPYPDQHRAHLASILAKRIRDERGDAVEGAAKEAHDRGDIGKTGCIEVWDWLTIRAEQERASDRAAGERGGR